MAKPGDVVEFKSGMHGIDAPRNLAVYVDRKKRKGTHWVRIVTVDGEKELKAEHLTRRAFRQRYEGRLDDAREVQARLRFLIDEHLGGRLVEEVEDDLGALEEALWEATCDAGRASWTEQGIAAAYYESDPTPVELKQVRAALDRCRRPGIGRFETVQGRGDTWRPWTRDEVARMRAAWQAMTDIRNRLLSAEETEDGRQFRRHEVEDWSDEERVTLAWMKDAMVQSIEHDGVPDKEVAGIGGLGAVAAFGMDLHRRLGFLAMDWIRTEPTTRSSDYIHFLLEVALWTADDAVGSLMRRHVNQEEFFEHVPDEAAHEAADKLPRPDEEADPGREDLRHLECYTIDPPDAKDFDDAVGIEPGDHGAARLWVHIADVSHYVRPYSTLDNHAKKRATSVYLPGRVLPMLPPRIADDLCSLRDDGDRFALSVALDVGADGRVQDASFHKALIRVDENLAYADALALAEAGKEPFRSLLDLAERMRTRRRGLAIETGEIRIAVGGSGFEAQEKSADPATRMIETFMVAANEAVAKHLADAEVGLLYRCHPLPDAQKAERFRHQLATVGIDVDLALPQAARAEAGGTQSLLDQLKAGRGSVNLFGGGLSVTAAGEDNDEEDEPTEVAGPTGFAALDEAEQEAWLEPFRHATRALDDHVDRGLAQVMTGKMLACMGRAFYTPDNLGHFGLASDHYCHFTSPIRRYPDLVVHRNLKWLISGGDGEAPHPAESLEAMCDHCSDQERAAADLERRLRSSCLVLASLTGDDAFTDAVARITGITPGRTFLDVGGIDAAVAGRDLPGGPFSVDEWESMLYVSDREAPQRFDAEDLAMLAQHYDEELGETLRVRARLGDKVTVALTGRDVAAGRTGARITAWRGR